MKEITITEIYTEKGIQYDFSDNSYNYIFVEWKDVDEANKRIENFFKGVSRELVFSDIANFIKK